MGARRKTNRLKQRHMKHLKAFLIKYNVIPYKTKRVSKFLVMIYKNGNREIIF